MPVSAPVIGTFKIKSIQRGEILFSSSVQSVVGAAISSVNTAKSKITLLGVRSSQAPDNLNMFTLSLYSATEIRAQRSVGTSVTASIAWEVVEYE